MTRGAPEQKPRKKQAVTRTYKTSTIALIRQNAASSPLLALPSELRERILVHLLGDKLIHIRFLASYEETGFNNVRGLAKKHKEKQGSFRHTICSRLSAFDAEEENLGDNSRHKDCVIYEEAYTVEDTVVLGASAHRCINSALVVLSVCRQLYEESNYILWSTNTFSFNRAGCLSEFITSLNPAQKRNLKKLHLIANSEMCGRRDSWLEPCSSQQLSMLRRLESLSLCIEHYFWPPLDEGPGTLIEEGTDGLWERYWKRYMINIRPEPLQVLPIKHLKITITGFTPRFLQGFANVRYLPEGLKAKYIEELSVKLLNPQGAEVQNALEAEANKIYQEKAVRGKDPPEVRKLCRAQNKVNFSRAKLKESEEQAARLQHDLDQVHNTLNDPKPGMLMVNHCLKLGCRAGNAHAAVNEYAAMLQHWEPRLDQMQKLAAAEAEKAAELAKTADAAQATGSEPLER